MNRVITVSVEKAPRAPRRKAKPTRACMGLGCAQRGRASPPPALGRWRFATRDYVCDTCRASTDKIITRSHVLQRYDVTFEQLVKDEPYLRVHKAPNPHGKQHPWCTYYYVRELDERYYVRDGDDDDDRQAS